MYLVRFKWLKVFYCVYIGNSNTRVSNTARDVHWSFVIYNLKCVIHNLKFKASKLVKINRRTIFIGYSQLLTISRWSTSNIANQIHGFMIDYEEIYTNFSYEFVICISPNQHHNFLLSVYIITFVYIVFPFTYSLPLQESVVEIEYVEKHPTPRPDNFLLHDDWVSSVSVSENWYVQ